MIHSAGAILICDHIWFAGPVIQYMTGQLWWLNEIILINNHKYVKRFIWFMFARERHLQNLQEALKSTKRAKINLRNQNVTLHDISFQHPNDPLWVLWKIIVIYRNSTVLSLFGADSDDRKNLVYLHVPHCISQWLFIFVVLDSPRLKMA